MMIIVLIVTAVQVLYCFGWTVDLILDFLWGILPHENYIPLYLMQPFSALISRSTDLYIVFQCVLILAIFICAVCIPFMKSFSVRTKICGGINLICTILWFILSFEFAMVLTLCSSIPLLCFLIADYKQRKQM